MNHLKQIAAKLDEYGVDAMLVNSHPGEFYAIGFGGEGAVVVTKDTCRYFTDSRYIESAEKQVTGCNITMSDRNRGVRVLVEQAVKDLGIGKLGVEDGYMTVAEHKLYSDLLPCELVPCQKLIGSLRASKDGEELARMQQAQHITDEAFSAILKFIQPGMTEREIAAKLQYTMFQLGADKISFDPIVVTGPNGSLPHGIPGDTRVERGSFITLDFGCKYGGYCSDMTRTIAVGEPTEEMRQVYSVVLEAQLAGIAAAKGGVPGKDIDSAARKIIEDAGYGAYFGHGFGHSLGIEIHEPPNANSTEPGPLPVGAMISAEPGIYLPGRFGVRIEDVLMLTENGATILTKSPKELIIL